MKAPSFWWRPRPSLAARALQPIGALIGAIAARRLARPGARAGVPVICVGNFTVGGAGKTPTAIEIAHHLVAFGQEPAFVSRGYGGAGGAAPVRVDPERHGAGEVGDEPLLLARVAPCFVGADRVAAAAAAVAGGATVVVMDDGLQNPSLQKTLRIAVVDGGVGIGNGLCLPAGPLRAPMNPQWDATDLVIVIGPGEAGDAVAAEAGLRRRPVLRAAIDPDARHLRALAGRRLFAFTGIGRPEKFFETLEEAGLALVGRRAFPDHHPFTAAERDALQASAAAAEAILVTTEKDRARLPADFAVAVLGIRLAFDDPETLTEMLGRVVGV